MRANRWWLALGYALATVVVQGVHDHGRATDETAARHEAGCSDPRPHVAGHPAPEAAHLLLDCPACQYRAEPHSWSFSLPSIDRPSVAAPGERPPAPARLRPLRLTSCRAPPRV